MDVVRGLLVILHLVGMAAIVGAWLSTLRVPRILPGMVHGALLQLVTGLLLVGLPLNMDGSPSEMSERAARFSRRLHGRFGIRCELMDERLSSFEARARMAGDSGRTALDSVAACVILEGWFAGQPRDGA